MTFEEIPHTADVAIRVRASSRRALWVAAGDAMTRLMVDPGGDEPMVARTVIAEGEDDVELMASWLSALLGWAEVDGVAWTRFDVVELPGAIDGRVAGVPLDRCVPVGPPIKAVTFHRLAVWEEAGEWLAEIVFDV